MEKGPQDGIMHGAWLTSKGLLLRHSMHDRQQTTDGLPVALCCFYSIAASMLPRQNLDAIADSIAPGLSAVVAA